MTHAFIITAESPYELGFSLKHSRVLPDDGGINYIPETSIMKTNSHITVCKNGEFTNLRHKYRAIPSNCAKTAYSIQIMHISQR